MSAFSQVNPPATPDDAPSDTTPPHANRPESSARPGPKGSRVYSAALRHRAAEMHLSGHTNAEIAQELKVSRRTVRRWLRELQQRTAQGIEARTVFEIRRQEAGV